MPSRSPVLRGVLVVGLLAVAALAIEARAGLDWAHLADRGSVRWARVVAGLFLLVGLGLMLRLVARHLRRPRRPPDDGPPRAREEGEGVPLVVRLLAVALLLAMLATLWWLQDQVLPGFDPSFRDRGAEEKSASEPEDLVARTPSDSWAPLVTVAAALAAVALASQVVARRRVRRADPVARTDDEQAEAQVLGTAVEAARTGLATETDARAAIVAAYRAMAGSLGEGLGERARRSDTPTELLDRAVRSGLVRPGPAAELTELFREARFSRHPMGQPQRRAAQQALTSVLQELGSHA